MMDSYGKFLGVMDDIAKEIPGFTAEHKNQIYSTAEEWMAICHMCMDNMEIIEGEDGEDE